MAEDAKLELDRKTRINLEKARVLLLEPDIPNVDILAQVFFGFGVRQPVRCPTPDQAMEALGQGRIDEGYAGIEEHGMAAAGHDATTLKATEMRDATSRACWSSCRLGAQEGPTRGVAARRPAPRSSWTASCRAHGPLRVDIRG